MLSYLEDLRNSGSEVGEGGSNGGLPGQVKAQVTLTIDAAERAV